MQPPPPLPRGSARPSLSKQQATAVLSDARWQALASRARAADGTFVYAVTTTGIYCRPSCPSRLPRPEHVRFCATPAAAETAGFRACRRCRPAAAAGAPDSQQLIARVCQMLEAGEAPPTLGELAAACALSPSHLHRLFKAATGLTPRAYGVAHRRARMAAALEHQESVTLAAYGAGFASSSGFYRHADAALGMTPTQFRRGGAGTLLRWAGGRCSLGALVVAASARGVCAVLFGSSARALTADLRRRFPHADLRPDATLAGVLAAVVARIEDPRHAHAGGLPLDLRGTVFQQRVWQELQRIACGRTLSYSELAARIGAPRAVRAVAAACAANAVAVLVPCHRVVARGGGLAGYRWGVNRKRAMLAREANAPCG